MTRPLSVVPSTCTSEGVQLVEKLERDFSFEPAGVHTLLLYILHSSYSLQELLPPMGSWAQFIGTANGSTADLLLQVQLAGDAVQ